jgi:hypothetical protein
MRGQACPWGRRLGGQPYRAADLAEGMRTRAFEVIVAPAPQAIRIERPRRLPRAEHPGEISSGGRRGTLSFGERFHGEKRRELRP